LGYIPALSDSLVQFSSVITVAIYHSQDVLASKILTNPILDVGFFYHGDANEYSVINCSNHEGRNHRWLSAEHLSWYLKSLNHDQILKKR
jgi:hypothetical protein